MTPAPEFHTLSDHLFHWSAYDPANKCELSSTAVRSKAGLVLLDPIPLEKSVEQELFTLAPLRAIVLTNGNHVRDSVRLRDTYKVPIVTAPLTRRDLPDLKPDIALMENELLYGLGPISIPGATLGETAFFHAENGVLILGDAVINLDSEKGLELLPAKYCIDAEQNRASLRKLLNVDFRILAFAHGTPLTTRAREKLSALLSS